MAPPPPEDDPEATLSLEEALRTLYIRVALVARRCNPKGHAYFHLVKAGERLERAYKSAVADRVGRN